MNAFQEGVSQVASQEEAPVCTDLQVSTWLTDLQGGGPASYEAG
jgi:hypothetical protein